MGKFITKFETTAAFEAAEATFAKPHVSLTKDDMQVHYIPYVEPIETRVVAKFNVTSTTTPTKIGYNKNISGFSAIEIDGVEQSSVVSAYTFDTLGEHTVKYTLADQTRIGKYAFYQCSGLTSIIIPNSVTSIGVDAFGNCSSLTSIDIPSGVTSIGESAFYRCTSLTNITIPNSVTSISGDAFSDCTSLTSIEIPNSITSIGDSAFLNCSSLTSITCNATTAPTVSSTTFLNVKTNGTLYVPIGSGGYDTWMQNSSYYLGYSNWTKVEQ